MANERQDDPGSASVEEWPKRTPPTIDLKATAVSGDTQAKADADGPQQTAQQTSDNAAQSKPRPEGGLLAKLLAPLSGALAALAVIALFWFNGLIGQPQPVPPAVSPVQFDNVAANVGDLTARLARVESSAAKAAAPAMDSALSARTEALEKSLSAARNELAALKSQTATTASALNDLKSTPGDGGAVPNLAPLTERLTRLEQAAQTLSADLAARKAPSADDVNVRRLVVANMLEAAVRRGAPYTDALAAAKQIAGDAALLAPLDAFATKGLPNDTAYLREIVQVLQQIAASSAAKASEVAKTEADRPPQNAGVLDRLQSGLSKLVRVERSDALSGAQNSEPVGVASLQASARSDDFAAVRRDLAKLPQADSPQVQAWIKSVNARDAALAAAARFSAEALAVFAKSGQ